MPLTYSIAYGGSNHPDTLDLCTVSHAFLSIEPACRKELDRLLGSLSDYLIWLKVQVEGLRVFSHTTNVESRVLAGPQR